MDEKDSERMATVGDVTAFVENMLCAGIEETVGGRLIDEIKRDVDGHVIVLSNGQVFRVAIFEVRS